MIQLVRGSITAAVPKLKAYLRGTARPGEALEIRQIMTGIPSAMSTGLVANLM